LSHPRTASWPAAVLWNRQPSTGALGVLLPDTSYAYLIQYAGATFNSVVRLMQQVEERTAGLHPGARVQADQGIARRAFGGVEDGQQACGGNPCGDVGQAYSGPRGGVVRREMT